MDYRHICPTTTILARKKKINNETADKNLKIFQTIQFEMLTLRIKLLKFFFFFCF